MQNPIAFALDVESTEKADRLIDLLEPHVGAFKIGLELFLVSRGWWPSTNTPVILDLKLHDIPETVARAVKAGGELGVKYMTLHVQQRKTLEMAVKAAEPYGITLLGVTVLTSMDSVDLDELGCSVNKPEFRARQLAVFGYECGLRGFVCSPQEVGFLSMLLSEAFFLVPGIRPARSFAYDQKRVGTPHQAVKDGAGLIVVGRPIRDASDPVEAAKAILAEVTEVPSQ